MSDTNEIVTRAAGDLERAIAAADAARKALAEAEVEVGELKAFLTRLERYAGRIEAASAAPANPEHVRNKQARSLSRPGTMARRLVDTSIEAIVKAGKPLAISDLLDVVLAAGLPVGGSDQKSNLAGYLSRDPRVHSLGRSVGWTVTGNAEPDTLEPSSPVTDPADGAPSAILPRFDRSDFDDLLGGDAPPTRNLEIESTAGQNNEQ